MSSSDFVDGLVSIITPAYKAENYIRHTIGSVVAQTYGDWELLVADDCSPDNTARVVREMGQVDPRIKLLQCEKNGGPAAARNLSLSEARGRWLAFLDSDDLWLPEKLSRTIEFAKQKQSALTFTGFRRISFDGMSIGRYVSVPGKLTYADLLGHTAIATSTVLVDRFLVGDVRMRSVFYDDFVCWLGILKDGKTAFGLDEDLMRYRVLAGSISRNKWRSAMEVWKTYRVIERLGFARSAWHFLAYSSRAMMKYSKF